MRILIIISHLYMGGFSKSLINFLHCIQAHPNFNITLLMLENQPTSLEKELPDNIKIIRLDLEYERSRKAKWMFEYYHYKYVFWEKFYQHIRKKPIPMKYIQEFVAAKNIYRMETVVTDFSFAKDYDVVISWEESFCNYILAKKMPAKRKIGYIHPNFVDAAFPKKLEGKYLKKFDRIVAISEECCHTLKKVFPAFSSKIVNIPNRLNIAHYKHMSLEFVPDSISDHTRILTIARAVDSTKSIFRMVDLLLRLKERGFKVCWYYIGDGPDFEELKKRIIKAGLQAELICLGALDNPCPYIVGADLYVQQSHYEGRPVVVDEAIVLHTPVLATNYSSAKEQIRDGVTGWIVDDNADAIFQKMEELLTQPELLVKAKEQLERQDNSRFEDCSAMISMLYEVCGRKSDAPC